MPNPIRPAGFDHIVLRIVDKGAMVAFYTDILGCTLDSDRPELGLTHIRAGASLIDLVTVDGRLGQMGGPAPGAQARNLDHFALAIRPFDEAEIRSHLAAHSVVIIDEGERYGAEGDGTSLYIQDPEGNTVELKGPSAA